MESKPDLIQDSILRIAAFVKEWPDQKLYDVYAFCQDGRMDFQHCCKCLLAVFGSDVLHDKCLDLDRDGIPNHYRAIKRIPQMAEIEKAYQIIGFKALPTHRYPEDQKLRDRRLLEILGTEIARRAINPVQQDAMHPGVIASDVRSERQTVGAL